MNESSSRWIPSITGVLWLCLVFAGFFALGLTVSRLRSAQNTLDQETSRLMDHAAELTQTVNRTLALDQETQFLQSLVDVLPQEKGFLRTQKAIADEVEILRYKVARRIHNNLHILVDTRANKLYVKKGLTLLWQADCSVGRGGVLVDQATGRRWEFVTPRGVFEVLGKYEKPVWTKPDWAFVEAKEDVPPPGDPIRRVEGELGAYVLNLGDGYLIHGTKNEAILGRPASHGCVRLGADNLKWLYENIPRGTKVFIY
jgi:lipoprotein-anchoring transpeptidase ErfK/SrfK